MMEWPDWALSQLALLETSKHPETGSGPIRQSARWQLVLAAFSLAGFFVSLLLNRWFTLVFVRFLKICVLFSCALMHEMCITYWITVYSAACSASESNLLTDDEQVHVTRVLLVSLIDCTVFLNMMFCFVFCEDQDSFLIPLWSSLKKWGQGGAKKHKNALGIIQHPAQPVHLHAAPVVFLLVMYAVAVCVLQIPPILIRLPPENLNPRTLWARVLSFNCKFIATTSSPSVQSVHF